MVKDRGQVDPVRWLIVTITAMVGIAILSALDQNLEVEGRLSGTAHDTAVSGAEALAFLAPDATTVLLAIVAILVGFAARLRQ